MDYTIVFPVAGEVRKNYKIKPLTEIHGVKLLSLALDSLVSIKKKTQEIIFILLGESKEEIKEITEICNEKGYENLKFLTLKKPTTGPADSIKQALKGMNFENPILFCDCDHQVDLKKFFSFIESSQPNIAVPLWSINKIKSSKWAIACVNDNSVKSIEEKKYPETNGDYYGVIGNYYFSSYQLFSKYEGKDFISQVIKENIKSGVEVKGLEIDKGYFFGDESMSKDSNFLHGSIFCDIDGTIVMHEDVPSYEKPLILLDGARDKLNEWRESGHMIILCSARKESDRRNLEKALKESDIFYDKLILGLPSGKRIVINDRKPTNITTNQSQSYDVERNEGIKSVHLNKIDHHIKKRFSGGSFAKTLLIEDHEKILVRKIISKRENLNMGYLKLKHQYNCMKNLKSLSNDLIPNLYAEDESSYEYFYDLEFLKDFTPLNLIEDSKRDEVLNNLISKLKDDVYSVSGEDHVNTKAWLTNYLETKIYQKFELFKKIPSIRSILFEEKITVNGLALDSLPAILEKISEKKYIDLFAPKKFSPVHGDLTFQNVFYHKKLNSIKLIDTDSSNYLEATVLDFGKLLQSIICKYDDWHETQDTLIFSDQANYYELLPKIESKIMNKNFKDGWSDILKVNRENIEPIGLFYLSSHMFRMVPYRYNISENQALTAFLIGLFYLNKSISM